jgi:hypothetical protein
MTPMGEVTRYIQIVAGVPSVRPIGSVRCWYDPSFDRPIITARANLGFGGATAAREDHGADNIQVAAESESNFENRILFLHRSRADVYGTFALTFGARALPSMRY